MRLPFVVLAMLVIPIVFAAPNPLLDTGVVDKKSSSLSQYLNATSESPLPSAISSTRISHHRLLPRKGGGGGGRPKGSGFVDPHTGATTKNAPVKLTKDQTFDFSKQAGLGKDQSASSYSFGGGNIVVLSKESPYAGRQAGSGTRNSVIGTHSYGSGYPYGSSGSYIDNRPFPYGFWPVPIQNNYYCQYECYYGHEDYRPGGRTMTAPIKSTLSSTPETYRLIGDEMSVKAVLDALIQNCSVADVHTQISTFNRDAVDRLVRPEQVIQWYRASSFALSLDSFNNTAALPENAPRSNTTSAPSVPDSDFPVGLNATFRECLMDTTSLAVPLIYYNEHHGLSRTARNFIITGSVVGFGLLLAILWCLCGSSFSCKRSKSGHHTPSRRGTIASITAINMNDNPRNK